MSTTYLTVPEIAERMRCSEWQAKRICRSGALRATKPNGRWLSTPEWVDEYMAGGENRVQSAARRRRRRAS